MTQWTFARANLLWTCYGEVTKLRTCYGEIGVMDCGLYWTKHWCHTKHGMIACHLPSTTSLCIWCA